MHPALKRHLIALPATLIATAAAYVFFPWSGLTQLPPPALFASGIGLGIIISAVAGLVAASAYSRPVLPAQPTVNSRQVDTTVENRPVRARREHDDGDERRTVFVGNLAYRTSPRQLRELFEPYGTVHSVRIATDRQTRKPRGYGFVEMDQSGAAQAIKALHGHPLCNRELSLSEARLRESRY